jgi:hypothetical protein
VLATERLLEIEEKFSEVVARIVLIEIDEETLRVILYLKDGANLRVTEQWQRKALKRYSYYWLTPTNELKVDGTMRRTTLTWKAFHITNIWIAKRICRYPLRLVWKM